jgi:hypothetical protein
MRACSSASIMPEQSSRTGLMIAAVHTFNSAGLYFRAELLSLPASSHGPTFCTLILGAKASTIGTRTVELSKKHRVVPINFGSRSSVLRMGNVH